MRAMVLDRPGQSLRLVDLPRSQPGPGQVSIRVTACGVCRTDLHVVDGDLTEAKLPIVPGHEIVGHITARGAGVLRFEEGQRVGVPWLGTTCGRCRYCANGRENLCDEARFTGYQIDGGYAEYTLADARYCFAIEGYEDDAEAAPLLCAGLIGHRSLVMTGDAERLGIYGFGAAAHIVAQVARWQGRRVFAFTRPGDSEAQDFASDLGAVWAGGSDQRPPEELDAAIVFAPVGALIPAALEAVAKGGVVVAGGIHMSDIPSFPYRILWGERVVRSVANLTLAPKVPVVAEIQRFALEDANLALAALREGRLRGAAVLVP
jgi:propanol-preferring alcohol dehydrogenase